MKIFFVFFEIGSINYPQLGGDDMAIIGQNRARIEWIESKKHGKQGIFCP